MKNQKAVWHFQWSLGVWFGPYCLPLLPPAPATVPLVDEYLHTLRRICCPTDSHEWVSLHHNVLHLYTHSLSFVSKYGIERMCNFIGNKILIFFQLFGWCDQSKKPHDDDGSACRSHYSGVSIGRSSRRPGMLISHLFQSVCARLAGYQFLCQLDRKRPIYSDSSFFYR